MMDHFCKALAILVIWGIDFAPADRNRRFF
jgi:hypothetical protein